MSSPLQKPQPSSSGLRWLALTVLVCSQLASATHLLGHAATHVDDTCAVCLKLDRDDASAAGEPGFASFTAESVEVDVSLALVPATAQLTRYQSRASP